MQDLLKEEEFIKPPYNPWRWFKIFYGIAVTELILIYFLVTDPNPSELNILTTLLLFLVTPLVMFFTNKHRKTLPLNTYAFASIILSLIYFVGIHLIKLINRPDRFFSIRTLNSIPSLLGLLFICYSISFIIILIYLKIKRDIQKVKAAESK